MLPFTGPTAEAEIMAEPSETIKQFVWIRWVGLGMQFRGVHRCAKCNLKRRLFRLGFAGDEPVSLSSDLCLACWRMRG